jgi:hypothetical protein
MLSLTQGWLNDSQLREAISAQPIGAAAYDNLRKSGAELARAYGLRSQVDKELASLGELLQVHDGDFDRYVRALYYHLTALIEAAATPELAHQYRELRDFLFPLGLSIVQHSYMAESGATVQIEESISTEQRAKLHSIRVADHTLGELYQRWIDAGRALGERELERMQLQASLSRQTPAKSSTKSMRYRWIRAVRMTIDAMDTMSLHDEARHLFMFPLLKCLANAQRDPGSPQRPGDIDIDPGDIDIDPGDIDIDPGDIDIDPGDIDALSANISLAAAEPAAMIDTAATSRTATEN